MASAVITITDVGEQTDDGRFRSGVMSVQVDLDPELDDDERAPMVHIAAMYAVEAIANMPEAYDVKHVPRPGRRTRIDGPEI